MIEASWGAWPDQERLEGELTLGWPVAGIDEAGRGPWAGPVTAAAVILDPPRPLSGLDDSKKLTARRRQVLEVEIRAKAHAWGVGWAGADEIDALGILQATFLAMDRAVAQLSSPPHAVLVDGPLIPRFSRGFAGGIHPMVKGDARSLSIAAASILAKEARDRWMAEIEVIYPGYGFAVHKGYGTAAHQKALKELGPCPIHRRSFRPVAVAAGL